MPPKVTVELPQILRPLCGGNSSAVVEGRDVQECLAALALIHPGLRTALFSANGGLDALWLIALDQTVLKPGSLKQPVGPGQTIRITAIAAGG